MLNDLSRRPSPSMVVALLALFLSLGGVSYGVATGSIGSRDIKNNAVRGADVRNNDIRGADVRTGTLRGSDVGRDALTGANVAESSLEEVPSAGTARSADRAANAGNADQLGGVPASGYLQTSADTIGRSGFDGACDPPPGGAFVDCATANITLARTSRLLVVGEAPFGTEAIPATGNCRIELDGVGLPNTTARTGLTAVSDESDEANVGFGVTTVTDPIAAGRHSLSVSCNEDGGGIDHNDTTISVVALGPA